MEGVFCVAAEVLDHREVAREHFVLTLDAPPIAARARPGQFAMVRPSEFWDPLLPRAYSFFHADPEAGCIEILYRVVGRGTRCLRQLEPGATLQVWGPLGNAFTPPDTARVVLVGGGVGVPPLAFWAERLARCGLRLEVTALIGAATQERLVGLDAFQRAGAALHVATDDGSRGHRGYVTDLLPPLLEAAPVSVYACGPMPMLAAVARVTQPAGVPTELALEAPMACGVGACIGCTVPRSGGGFYRVCTDGPVFPAEAIAWE